MAATIRMRSLVSVMVGVCLVAAFTVVTTEPVVAEVPVAATPQIGQLRSSVPKSWMTRKEYRKLMKLMTIERVRKIVGSKGSFYYSDHCLR